jgi:hypothetical protein
MISGVSRNPLQGIFKPFPSDGPLFGTISSKAAFP